MNFKKPLITSMCLFITTIVMAQSNKITGKVTDETGVILPGVSISLIGTNRGTLTNTNGMYSIEASPQDSLSFSFVGMEKKIIKVGASSRIDVVLSVQTNMLQEIVTVAYGTQRKRDITASVASVKSDRMQDVPTADLSRVLQGKLAGVRIASSSGMPGMANSILIRGAGSVNASNAPLVVIDGVPVSSVSDASMYNGQELNPLMDINPLDIASVDVLKDASAAA